MSSFSRNSLPLEQNSSWLSMSSVRAPWPSTWSSLSGGLCCHSAGLKSVKTFGGGPRVNLVKSVLPGCIGAWEELQIKVMACLPPCLLFISAIEILTLWWRWLSGNYPVGIEKDRATADLISGLQARGANAGPPPAPGCPICTQSVNVQSKASVVKVLVDGPYTTC